MKEHRHGQGWPICACGIRYPIGCPVCDPVHVRLHHGRRRRLRKAAKKERT